nr:aminotransferase class V-fold PLP-dependent enzyme [Candidatus Njordarchaeum guaymaensis]
MRSYAEDFGPFENRVWLNAAGIGPMPRIAVEAAHETIAWSQTPSLASTEKFHDVPLELKRSLGQLINGEPQNIVLGNSASYGLHLWANGLPFKSGDEILLVKGDFPATILPWLALRNKGVIVREIQPEGHVLSADDLRRSITESTRVLCATWVDSFTGFALDVEAIGRLCRENGIQFLLNATQGLGARQLDVSKTPIDGITSSGYKWLCGPYGTGFCWMQQDALESLQYNQAYWLVMQGDRDLDRIRDYRIRNDVGAERYDVFGTANFFNFVPWTKSIEYLNTQGILQIQKHNDNLVETLTAGIDTKKYKVLSPRAGNQRTAIIVISHREEKMNKTLFETLTKKGVDISLREGNLRLSPHLYNTSKDIDVALSILNENG